MQARAQGLGFDGLALGKVLDRANVTDPPTPDRPEADELYRWLASPDGLTARASTFGEREVIKAICNALPHGGRVGGGWDRGDGSVRTPEVGRLGKEGERT